MHIYACVHTHTHTYIYNHTVLLPEQKLRDMVSFLYYPFKYVFQKIQKNEGGYILSHVCLFTRGGIFSRQRVITSTGISHVVYFSEVCKPLGGN